MNGPTTVFEARQAELKLRDLKASHAFYCSDCIRVKYSKTPDAEVPCLIAGIYNMAIGAAMVRVETVRMVGGEG